MPRLNALVIGNATYDHGNQLKKPTNDADDLAKVLTRAGFTVTKLTDATFTEMKRAVTAFEAACNNGGDVSLFYFAGHGVEIRGVNYLVGKDTGEDEIDIESGALSLDHVIQHMEPQNGDTRTTIIILDACRDRPFSRKWRGKPHNLAPVYAPRGTLIAFATSPGQYAADGSGRNGAYTEALLKHMEEPDIPIEVMFKNVRNTLAAATRQKQISWEHTSLAGDFFFKMSVAASITEYGPTAIADKTFILDEAKFSHRTIRALKSLSWYAQNPALEKATADKLDKAGTDSLFVLGRNILQAANGSAHAAEDWIARFPQHTLRMEPAKRKALLDGILFEIFFDADGRLRQHPKTNRFNEVFDLQRHPEFKDSFDFIAAALADQAGSFFAIPGKGQTVTVDIRLGDDNLIEGVFVGGIDYLGEDDDPFTNTQEFRKIRAQRFQDELTEQMLVSRRFLKLVYSKPITPSDKIKLPYNAIVTRPNP